MGFFFFLSHNPEGVGIIFHPSAHDDNKKKIEYILISLDLKIFLSQWTHLLAVLSDSMLLDGAVRLMSDELAVVMLSLTLCLEEPERLARERIIKET